MTSPPSEDAKRAREDDTQHDRVYDERRYSSNTGDPYAAYPTGGAGGRHSPYNAEGRGYAHHGGPQHHHQHAPYQQQRHSYNMQQQQQGSYASYTSPRHHHHHQPHGRYSGGYGHHHQHQQQHAQQQQRFHHRTHHHHQHHHHHSSSGSSPYAAGNQQVTSMRQALARQGMTDAVRKFKNASRKDLNEECAVRIGVIGATEPLTEQQLVDEIDSIKLTHRLSAAIVEKSNAPAARQAARGRSRTADEDDSDDADDDDDDENSNSVPPSSLSRPATAEPQQTEKDEEKKPQDEKGETKQQQEAQTDGGEAEKQEKPTESKEEKGEPTKDDANKDSTGLQWQAPDAQHEETAAAATLLLGLEKKPGEEQPQGQLLADSANNGATGTDATQQHASIQWGVVYFRTRHVADHCIKELNVPGRVSKWRNFVTQRPPLPGPQCGEVGVAPYAEACVEDPADTVVLETQEGFVHFSTNELFRTKGLDEYLSGKKMGIIIRRLICKHFDPLKRTPCRFGTLCSFVHVKAIAMPRLLRTVPAQLSLRHHHQAKQQSGSGGTAPNSSTNTSDSVQLTTWEHDRRSDVLIVRDIDPAIDDSQFTYMFSACPGYKDSFVRHFIIGDEDDDQDDAHRYGVVMFVSAEYAQAALHQTFDAGLNIGFFGALEDARLLQTRYGEDEAAAAAAICGRESVQFASPQSGTMAQSPHSSIMNTSNLSSSSALHTPRGDDGSATRVTSRPSTDHRYQMSVSSSARRSPIENSADKTATTPTLDNASGFPFPTLPEGWVHGVSRRLGQYYFYQLHSKQKTTWKHPLDGESYFVKKK